MAARISALNAEGAKLFRDGQYADVERMSALAKGLGKLVTEGRTLRQKWNAASPQDSLPAPERPAAPTHRTDGIAIEMHYNRAHATAIYNGNSVILNAGSTIRKECLGSLSERLHKLRTQCRSDGTVIPDAREELLSVTRDIEFGSPSAAAQFVAGCSVSGNRDWHVAATGIPLGEQLRQEQCLHVPEKAAHGKPSAQLGSVN